MGVTAVGTIVPPRMSEFGLFIGMDGQFDVALELKGNASVRIASMLLDKHALTKFAN